MNWKFWKSQSADDFAALTAQVRELLADNEALKSSRNAAEDKLSQANSAKIVLEQEIAKLRMRVREQTEADLMLVSARIIAAALRGEKAPASDVAMQQSLLSQQQMLGSNLGYLGGLGGLLWPH